MELILKTPIEELVPKLIAFNNEEIIKELKPRLEEYKTVVYNEDEIGKAKEDRANLNRFEKAIEDERKRIKKTYLEPYEKFEAQVKEITALIKESSGVIDSQLKVFEEKRETEKMGKITIIWKENVGELENFLDLQNVFNDRWLNATYSIKKVEEDIKELITKAKQDLEVISSFKSKDENILKDFYCKTLDLTKTMQEKARLEEIDKKLSATKSSESTMSQAKNEQEVKVVDFRVWATKDQLAMIKEFLIKNEIKYGGVPKEK